MPTPRRSFLKTIVVAPLAPGAATALAQPPEPGRSVSPTPVASPSPSPPGPVAEALARVVEERYGSQLEAADLREIAKSIDESLQGAERLRQAMKLTNADEPVNIFGARPPAGASRW